MFGLWEAGLLLAIVVVLFGVGKLPTVMGDLAKGLKRFKADMAEDDAPSKTEQPAPPAQLTHAPPAGGTEQRPGAGT